MKAVLELAAAPLLHAACSADPAAVLSLAQWVASGRHTTLRDKATVAADAMALVRLKLWVDSLLREPLQEC